MCDDMLNKKEQITLEKARSIEDLTASLERFGTLEEEEVSADLFAELDEVIGGFMQLSKQHFVVQSTLTIDEHSVSATNIEELADHADPQLAPRIIIPPTNVDYFENQPFQLRAVVAGIPKPQIRWYKSKMILDSNTRMVDVLGRYTLTADNIHGSAEVCALVKYGAKRPTSVNISASNSSIDETSVYTARSGSEYTCIRGGSETEIETVVDYSNKRDENSKNGTSDLNSSSENVDELYIPSSDSE